MDEKIIAKTGLSICDTSAKILETKQEITVAISKIHSKFHAGRERVEIELKEIVYFTEMRKLISSVVICNYSLSLTEIIS